jgi:hypothetical protein
MKHPLDPIDHEIILQLADAIEAMYPPIKITQPSQIPQTLVESAQVGFRAGQHSVAQSLRDHVSLRMRRAMEK